MSRAPLGLAVALLAGRLASSAAAQRPGGASGVGWLPREVRPIAGLSVSQRAAALATLDRIERLLRRVPELGTPDGFEIKPVIAGGSRQLGPHQKEIPGSVVEYQLSLMFFVPSMAVAGEGCSCITVQVNPTQSGSRYDAEGRLIYIEEPRARESRGTAAEAAGILWQVPRATQVYGELWEPSKDIRPGRGERSGVDVLFVSAGELPWLPVSREAFYAASLLELDAAQGSGAGDLRASLAKTPYQRWMEEAAERKKNREEALGAAATTLSAAEIAKLRQAMEATEREVTERLSKTDVSDRERNREALAAMDRHREAFRVELERMTPEERRMPAYIDNALAEGPSATGWRLTTDPAPPAWRVLTPNYDFWRARRSPAEVRSIRVHIGISGTGLRPKVRQALLQTFRNLDWSAVNQLLDTPR